MKIKKGFVVRKVAGENIVVPVGDMSKTFHGMIRLNDTGNFLWNFFLKDHTEREAVEALLSEYEVDRATAEADVEKFSAILRENDFVG